MDIGQHFLEGSIVKLNKPFLITEKITEKIKTGGGSGEIENSVLIEREGESSSTMVIVGFAKKKIIFNTRPKPMGLKS